MSSLVRVVNGVVLVTSKDVADKFGKENKNVMRDIKKIMSNQPEFGALNFELSNYKSVQNKELECYNMTRDGFTILAMGFSGAAALEWKIKYIEAFNMMERELLSQASNKSSMQLLNEAVLLMTADKDIASVSGKQLSDWRNKKRQHEQSIKDLVSNAQMKLGFNV